MSYEFLSTLNDKECKDWFLDVFSTKKRLIDLCYVNDVVVANEERSILIYNLKDIRRLAKLFEKTVIVEDNKCSAYHNCYAYFEFDGIRFNTFSNSEEVASYGN